MHSRKIKVKREKISTDLIKKLTRKECLRTANKYQKANTITLTRNSSRGKNMSTMNICQEEIETGQLT